MRWGGPVAGVNSAGAHPASGKPADDNRAGDDPHRMVAPFAVGQRSRHRAVVQ